MQCCKFYGVTTIKNVNPVYEVFVFTSCYRAQISEQTEPFKTLLITVYYVLSL